MGGRGSANEDAGADEVHAKTPARRPDQELFVLLALERHGRVLPMSLSLAPKKGDGATVALYRRERNAAIALLESSGWRPAPEPEEQPAETQEV